MIYSASRRKMTLFAFLTDNFYIFSYCVRFFLLEFVVSLFLFAFLIDNLYLFFIVSDFFYWSLCCVAFLCTFLRCCVMNLSENVYCIGVLYIDF